MEENILEKRQCARFPATFPVSITPEFLGTSVDLSEGGLRFTLDKPLLHLPSPKVKIRFSPQESIETEFKVVWNRYLEGHKFNYGVRLLNLGGEDYQILKNILVRIEYKKEIKKFTLLIDGQDVDTGIYEYFPYADRVITDFKNTYKIINCLKRGEVPFDCDKYVYARYCVNDEQTNQNAIHAAYRASKKFRYFPISIRRKILGDIHKNLLKKKEELLEIFVIEGHPRKLAEWEFSGMEKAYRKESLDFFKDELWMDVGKKNNETMHLVRRPDGVVCVSPPKNAACSNSLTAGFALLGGNTLIIKPPLHAPLATIYLWKEIVWKAAKDNGAPAGTVNIVIGNSMKITEEWLSSLYVNDIIYFGDSKMGLALGSRAFQAGKKPILELSGNDMMFVWKDANLSGAINSLTDAFLGSMQICMVPKAAIIHKTIFDQFVERFIEQVKKLKVGLPSHPEIVLTPVILMEEFFEFLDDALKKGAKLVYGGERLDYQGNKNETGIFVNPAILLIEDDRKAMEIKCVKQENFFPLLPLVKVCGTDQEVFKKMIDFANFNEYGLRTSVWVNSGLYIKKFIRYIHNSGLLRINSRHVDFSLYLSTHGGTGKTGGPYGEMNYVWQKTTHLQGISIVREKKNTK